MRHPRFQSHDIPVFDHSRTGERLRAERQDEPGAEDLALEGHGTRGFEEDLRGDWAWKPQRDKSLGAEFQTFAGALASHKQVNVMGCIASVRVLPVISATGDNIDPETGAEVRNLKKGLL